MTLRVCEGDLLDQEVEVIVNASASASDDSATASVPDAAVPHSRWKHALRIWLLCVVVCALLRWWHEPPDAPQSVSAETLNGTVSRFIGGSDNMMQITEQNQSVSVSWDGVPGARSYSIYWSLAAPLNQQTANRITGASRPYLHSPENGRTYYYAVTAVRRGRESALSRTVSATPTYGGRSPR